MSLEVFPWPCCIGSSFDETPRVLEARFGEGYRQRTPDGLNPILPSWPIVIDKLSLETMGEILAFFRARGAVEPFLWAPPGETEPSTWLASSWKGTPEQDHTWTINVTFERVT